MAKRRVKSSVAFGSGGIAGAAIAVALLFGFQGCQVGPIGPAPDPGPAVKAVKMVAVVDTDAPSIPLQNALDCPLARAGK